MAHKYSNFASANSDLTGEFADVKEKLEWAMTNAQQAYAECSDPVDKNHFGWATYAIECLVVAMRGLGDFAEEAYDQSHFYEALYWAAREPTNGDPYVLTWKKICEAWAVNDFEGRAVTIGFIDRMREMLWDEPFSAQWAARPEQEY